MVVAFSIHTLTVTQTIYSPTTHLVSNYCLNLCNECRYTSHLSTLRVTSPSHPPWFDQPVREMPKNTQRQCHFIVSSQTATDRAKDRSWSTALYLTAVRTRHRSACLRELEGSLTLFPAPTDSSVRTSDQVFCAPQTLRLITSRWSQDRRVAYMIHNTDMYRNVVRKTLGEMKVC